MIGLVFAGGGTGGHLYPGLAVAEAVRARQPETRITFLCSDRPLDAELLRAEGVAFEVLPAAPFVLRPRKLARCLAGWGPSVRATRAVLRGLKDECERVELVAVGGFVAAPAAQAAKVERVPVTLLNLDAVPGKANRLIARRAHRIVTAAPTPQGWERIPPIVRASARPPGDARTCRERLGLDPDAPTLLVTGGSQGARSVNEMMAALVHEHPDALRGWQVIHQTGKGDDSGVAQAYADAGVRALVQDFFGTPGLIWGAGELAVSRAGAGSVADAWAAATPTLFMPYPYHRDEHQRRNAEPLVDAGLAVLGDDLIDASRNLASPGTTLLSLLGDDARRDSMRAAAATLGPPDGAERLAEMVLR